MNINVVKLGQMRYSEALGIQEKLLALRQEDAVDDTLLIVEHPPVITLGRRGKGQNILVPEEKLSAEGIEIYEVNRGGDVTYHGPGQIVGYPIMNLKNHGRDVRKFVWNIEEVIIELLDREFGITAGRINGLTGVWVNDEKITAIGFAIKHWVTMHGFAFNVNTNLEHFKWIIPCGIKDKGVTSVERILNKRQEFQAVVDMVINHFCRVFDMNPTPVDINTILSKAGDTVE
ncbi:MAG TPA: lipoyl(octanoyl) transferase LipB [Clostridiaceae bacterium]|nr:lipoyl(octanoyl) transferase LipB [Clostridiaceae bacterium]